MEEVNSPESFDRKYVQELRAEAAKYRTEAKELKTEIEQLKSLDAQIKAARVENELIRRGIEADPNWIAIKDGQTPAEAVDKFLEKYPVFHGETEQSVEHKPVPKAIGPNQNNVTSPAAVPNGTLGTRGLDEIKNDPAARSNLRDLYRDLLRTSSNHSEM